MANDELPEGWGIAPIGSLCTRTENVNPARQPRATFEYIDVSAISNESWSITSSTAYQGSHAPSRARKLVREGDVIFATVRPTLKRVALIPGSRDGQVASTAFCVLRSVPEKLNNRFLYYSLLTEDFTARMENLQRGASYPAVSDSGVIEQEIPLPSLPEQQAIAGVLSKLQGAVEAQDKIIATLQELKAATLAKLFREGLRGEPLKETEIGEIPESWEVVRLGDVAKVGNGSTPSRETPTYWREGTIPWITSTKVHDLYIKTADEFVTEQAFKKCHLPLVSRGSIVVAITGQGKTLGHAAMVELETCINQHLAYLTVKDGAMSSEFILAYLQTCYDDLRQAGSSGGTTKGALTCGFLSQHLIPKPPIEEQEEIASTFRRLYKRLLVTERSRNYYQSLFQSMLHLLMTGEVRVPPLVKGAPP